MIPSCVEEFIVRPNVFLTNVKFDTVIAFLEGYDVACNRGLLIGFREWSIAKLGHGNNLYWSELLKHLILQTINFDRQSFELCDQAVVVSLMSSILREFWQERDSENGLPKIYHRYHKWLRTQEWYDETSPFFFE